MDPSKDSSSVTAYVLNTADGVPASRMALSLHRLNTPMMIWNLLDVGTTDEQGRCAGLTSSEGLSPGMYKLRFETGQYWETLGQTYFYPYIETVFTLSSLEEHVPLTLLLSRFSYSSYRGN